ncbi:hypothetical protein pb186bvf_010476 [Paramecium bursaria]
MSYYKQNLIIFINLYQVIYFNYYNFYKFNIQNWNQIPTVDYDQQVSYLLLKYYRYEFKLTCLKILFKYNLISKIVVIKLFIISNKWQKHVTIISELMDLLKFIQNLCSLKFENFQFKHFVQYDQILYQQYKQNYLKYHTCVIQNTLINKKRYQRTTICTKSQQQNNLSQFQYNLDEIKIKLQYYLKYLLSTLSPLQLVLFR